MTSFNLLTFFHADINQSEVEDRFQLASDWIKSVRKNLNKSKAGALLGWIPNEYYFKDIYQVVTRIRTDIQWIHGYTDN